jgi:hypothetical protein
LTLFFKATASERIGFHAASENQHAGSSRCVARNRKLGHKHFTERFAIVQFHIGSTALNGALQAIDHFEDHGLFFALGPSCIDFDFLQLSFSEWHI